MSQNLTLDGFRLLFPHSNQTVYLNTAGSCPGAQPVVQALQQAIADWAAGQFSTLQWDEAAQITRKLFAQLIGATSDNVALLATTSEAAATIARSLPRGRVVVGESEFRSNLFPWVALADHGYQLTVVPAINDVVSTEALIEAIDEQTVLVAVSTVQFLHGYRVQLKEIEKRAHEVGARLFVDVTQSLGVLSFNLADIPADFVVAHGYKWLLCPRGTTWLYVAPQRLSEIAPLAPNWKSVEEPFSKMHGGPLQYATNARKLDLSPAWFSWVGAEAALRLLLSLNAQEVEAHCLHLAQIFRQEAQAHDLQLVEEGLPSQIIGIRMSNPDAVRNSMARLNIIVGTRGTYLRLGFHAFNNEEDVKMVLKALPQSIA